MKMHAWTPRSSCAPKCPWIVPVPRRVPSRWMDKNNFQNDYLKISSKNRNDFKQAPLVLSVLPIKSEQKNGKPIRKPDSHQAIKPTNRLHSQQASKPASQQANKPASPQLSKTAGDKRGGLREEKQNEGTHQSKQSQRFGTCRNICMKYDGNNDNGIHGKIITQQCTNATANLFHQEALLDGKHGRSSRGTMMNQ